MYPFNKETHTHTQNEIIYKQLRIRGDFVIMHFFKILFDITMSLY